MNLWSRACVCACLCVCVYECVCMTVYVFTDDGLLIGLCKRLIFFSYRIIF